MSWTQVTEEVTAVGATVSSQDVLEDALDKVLEHNKMVHDITTAKAKKEKPRMKSKVSVLEEAQSIIYGDREKTYGHPAKNLKTIASMWTAYMNNMDDGNFNVTAKDVAAMMMLVKVARFANDPSHRDNLVDVCGYAALIERCDEVK